MSSLSAKVIQQLSAEEMGDVLRDDRLNVRREEMVHDLVKTWIDGDPDGRKHHYLHFLKCVRFGNASVAFIDNVILKEQYVEECGDREELDHYLNGTPGNA